ncbi:hypothetical protein GPECTOR_85g339 [Gonium pectorale]|uniref:Uncharacterized protein n=1 Tax=Gonium pectorale TaxID=33097 RepID=A0A150G170_GONPE|nr:hypothetical protein GPECTOR_85g339 [Gonium pectorale]|eukprot:KXZ43609.1 hypothetical protein GPECTOR_85g339 [Gonium pectorale]
MEMDGGSVTFQPEINRRSAQLVAERQRQQPEELAAMPANERLYLLAQEHAARRRAEGDDLGSSFGDVSGSRDQRLPHERPRSVVPAINPRSRALAESSDLPQDFLARQAYLAALSHEKRALYRSLLEESTCTFQPQLHSRAGSLNSSACLGPGATGGGPGSSWSGGSNTGDGGDRLNKLAYDDVQRKAALREALEQHHYGQFTFQPAINERSRRIGRRHSLTDLYRDDQRHAKLERLAAGLEAQRAAECTFRPTINARSASLGRQRRGSLLLTSAERHEQANKLRSSILVEALALKDYQEMKECTFTPAINRQTPKPTGPVPVPGLGRHLELRDLARKKKEADEARRVEVWNMRPKSPGPRVGITVPQPFSFETRVLPWQRTSQQRRAAEERRAAQLQKIIHEVQAEHVQGANEAHHLLSPTHLHGPPAAVRSGGPADSPGLQRPGYGPDPHSGVHDGHPSYGDEAASYMYGSYGGGMPLAGGRSPYGAGQQMGDYGDGGS